jgi:hypothetical protein
LPCQSLSFYLIPFLGKIDPIDVKLKHEVDS